MTGKVDSVNHSNGSSTVKLQGSDVTVSGSLVLDATGHSRRLVQFDKKFDPGYQGAYGIIAGGWGCRKFAFRYLSCHGFSVLACKSSLVCCHAVHGLA
jgi:hypothetical protein